MIFSRLSARWPPSSAFHAPDSGAGSVLLETGELVSHPGIGTRVAPLSVRKRINMRAPRIIGLLLPDLGSPFFSEIAESVEYAALQHGYQVLLCNSQHQLAFEERHLASSPPKRWEA